MVIMATKSKAKRLSRYIRPIAEVMKEIKAETEKTATAAEVVAKMNGVFKDENELGSWLAGGVTRMDAVDAKKHGTNLHKFSTIVLNKLRESSPASIFETGAATDAQFSDYEEEEDLL